MQHYIRRARVTNQIVVKAQFRPMKYAPDKYNLYSQYVTAYGIGERAYHHSCSYVLFIHRPMYNKALNHLPL